MKAKKNPPHRPRTDPKVLRVSRGVRLHPDLLRRVDRALKENRIVGAENFSEATEIALTRLVLQSGG